jgi:hypothetical protein
VRGASEPIRTPDPCFARFNQLPEGEPERAAAPGALDHLQLRRFLNALRLQLWWRDALVVAAVSGVAGALIGAAVVVWPARPAWLILATSAIGALIAVARRPSVLRAARIADRQLSTSSRLATAAEVLEGCLGGRLALAQLDDAWRLASAIRPWHAYPQAWRRVRAAGLALSSSLLLMALSLCGVLTPLNFPGLAAATPEATPSQTLEAAATTGALAALPLDPSSNPAAAAQTLDELEAAAAQSRVAEAALQKLADALRPTSAARDVGDALQSGHYDDAANKLATLGVDADQLSRVSKRELGNAMQRAAYDTAKLDPPLAIAEEAVARTLNHQVYTETKQALENLASTVTATKNGIVSQDALAKSLQQVQQQAPAHAGGGGDAPSYIPDTPGAEPNPVGLVRGAPSTIQVPGPEGDPRTADRSSAGLDPGGDPLGELAARLNVPPVDVPIDTQLANDTGRDKPNPAAPTVKISDTTQNGVQPSGVAQPDDPVQDVAEQTIEPTAQRDAVRSFFKPAGTRTQTEAP